MSFRRILTFCSSRKWGHLAVLRSRLVRSDWLVGLAQNLPTNLCPAGNTNKRGLCRINQYKPRTDANLPFQPRNLITTHGASGSGADRYSRMSSMYNVPLAPLPSMPILSFVTFCRSMPSDARSIFHCFHSTFAMSAASPS